MKTIKMYRASGFPVANKHNELYIRDINDEMDRLEKEHGKITSKNTDIFQEKLEELDKKLLKKYPRMVHRHYPDTLEAMTELCKEYGSVAFCIEDDELVSYILDA